MFSFSKNVIGNTKRLLIGKNILYLAIAVVLSIVIVYSGLDWYYFSTFRNSLLFDITFPAIAFGALIPVFGTLIYLLIALFRSDKNSINTSKALIQASILGYLTSTFLKVFTGRIEPPREYLQGMLDTSHGFNFGFLEHGIFWGWPSSHTTIAFAMMSVILIHYSRNKFIKFLAIFYAFYVGIGVSISIHWLSEFIVGAILGTLIGRIVGESFLEKMNSNR